MRRPDNRVMSGTSSMRVRARELRLSLLIAPYNVVRPFRLVGVAEKKTRIDGFCRLGIHSIPDPPKRHGPSPEMLHFALRCLLLLAADERVVLDVHRLIADRP